MPPAGLTLPDASAQRTRRWSDVAPEARTAARSAFRDEVIDRVLDHCLHRPDVPVVLITGRAGIGRSTVLAQVRRQLAEQQVPTVDVPMPRRECDAADLAVRLADELGAPPARGESGPAVFRRLLATLTGQRSRLVVFLDDAHRISQSSVRTAITAITALAGTRITFVCAARTGGPDRADLESLRERELVHLERLRPLNESEVERLLTETLNATPAPGLSAALRNSCRGIPAVVQAAVEGYLASDRLRVVDRHAYLVGSRAPRLPIKHPLFAELCEPKSPTWAVLKSLAVLHPLQEAAPALVAECVGQDEAEVIDALRALGTAGALLPNSRSNSWRFRVPMLAALLGSCLGPFERRKAAQLAVTAIWNGDASTPDQDYLPERLVDAGELVDPERAAAELLAHSATSGNGDRRERWRWSAAKLIVEPAHRVAVLHRQAVSCAVRQRFGPAGEAAELALSALPDEFPADPALHLQIIRLAGSAGTGDTAAVHDFVVDGWRSMSGGEPARIVARAAALCLLNRWRDAHEQLTSNSRWRRGTGSTSAFGQLISDATASSLGMPPIAKPAGPSTDDASGVARLLFRALNLPAGEGRGAGPGADTWVGSDGRWDQALSLARSTLATASVRGAAPGWTSLYRGMATILIARGQLNRAREVLDEARSRHLLLPHLLALPAAELERTLGAHDRCRAALEEGLALAAEDGILVGTDELWLRLAEWESRRGNRVAGLECAARIERLAERLGTTAARRNHLLARVVVEHDTAAVDEIVEISRASAPRADFAGTALLIAESGFGSAAMLREAYDSFGELDALIPRAQLRLLMRARNITVPGRGATVAETERLLATLVSDGLTNQQAAVVLGTSAKSVEGRLTRFFQRTGYRSRAELATATLRGSTSASA